MIKTYNIEGLSCASCASSAQKILSRIDGIENVRVNYAAAKAVVESEYEVDIFLLNEKLTRAGYRLLEKHKDSREKQLLAEALKLKRLKNELIIAFVFALPLFVIAMFFHGIIPHRAANLIMFFLCIPVMFYSGSRFFVSAWRQLRIVSSNMDTLVALGTGTAFLFSVFNTFFPKYLLQRDIEAHVYYETAGVLIFFILLGKYFEESAKKKTSTALDSLMSLNVQELNLLHNGTEKKIPIEATMPDDIVIVKPGDKVPLDGLIIFGETELDESMLSGEPMPKFKQKGDQIFAGTINLNGYIQFSVTKTADNTVLSQIIALVESAQGTASPIQKMVDRISAFFVPVVILISILSAFIWYFAGPEPKLTYALIAALTVLVISCPCALGLATPTAIMVGIGRAAAKGILIKSAESLQNASNIDVILFDKTGTLTEGKPTVNSIKLFDENPQLLSIITSLEHHSTHPISRSICEYLKEYNHNLIFENFENISGRGLKASFSGLYYFAGNSSLIHENGINFTHEQEKYIVALYELGQTAVFFADAHKILAIFSLSDKINSSAAQAIQALKFSGKEIYMLSGDNQRAAELVAEQLGIKNVLAELLPGDKTDFVKKLRASGKKVAMVGDGINDAAALANADLGIAMNSGTNIAVESADAVLLNNNLLQIPELLHISKRTMAILRQNLFWAFFYNVLGIPIAAGILYPFSGMLLEPMIAGAAMAFSSVSVVLNSLRI